MREIDTSHELVRANSEELNKILGWAFPVLDHGFVRVIDYMGDDEAIVQAARVSYTRGTKQTQDTKGLINYLMRHAHTSPFEMCEIKFHLKMPMFIGEQTLRHRTANVNKESGRYSILSEDKYIPEPERLAVQSKTNKQGSGDVMDMVKAMNIIGKIEFVHNEAQKIYEELTSADINLTRELARGILPANQYAEFYWKLDLHNLFHFLKLRNDEHAQWEIQQYAEIMENIVASWVPKAYEAYTQYKKNSVNFSEKELKMLGIMFSTEYGQSILAGMMAVDPANFSGVDAVSKGEWREFLVKLENLKKQE